VAVPLFLLLNRAQRAVRRRTASSVAANLGSLQAGVLFQLDSPKGAGFGEVTRALKTTAPRLSELINRMADAGLVTRTADPNDRRAQRLVLTPKGRKARATAMATSVDLVALMTEGFTSEQLALVARWLETVQARCDDPCEPEMRDVSPDVHPEGIPKRRGARLKVPVALISPDEATALSGLPALFAGLDAASSNRLTREEPGWTPKGKSVIEDLETGSVFEGR
jgi:DNA-binding MarR family transcriptional regulator